MKPNQHPGVCHHCGGHVAAMTGELERVANGDGDWSWQVKHRAGDCVSPEQAPSVEPYWWTFPDFPDYRPIGTHSDSGGVRLHVGAVAPAGAVPGNDAARKIAERSEKP